MRSAVSLGGDGLLDSGAGNDTYVWGTGSGQDMIDNGAAGVADTDTLTLGAGLTPDQLVFTRRGSDLVVRLREGEDQLTVRNHYAGAPIDLVKFANAPQEAPSGGGTVWNTQDIDAHIVSGATEGADILTGTDGDDLIFAAAGNDTLYGGYGSDTYALGRGSGNDLAWEFQGALPGDANVINNNDNSWRKAA